MELKSGSSAMKIHLYPSRQRMCGHCTSRESGCGGPARYCVMFMHCYGVIQEAIHEEVGQSRFCAWQVPRNVTKLQDKCCFKILIHFLSLLKGQGNSWLECEITLRDIGSPFNCQCSGTPWNDQSSVRGPKCEVCMCSHAGILRYLYLCSRSHEHKVYVSRRNSACEHLL